jgi:hypothetical protein
VVSFDREGYFGATVGAIPAKSGTTNVKAVLVARAAIGTVDADKGGSLSGASMSLTFRPKSFLGVDGSPILEPVTVYGAFLDPGDEDFGSTMPGGDFAAKDGSGTKGVLTSYGALAVEAQTASGQQAQVVETVSGCVPVPASMRDSAPSSMPVWVLNSVTAQWESVSQATRQGDQYCFDIRALGRINCDIFSRFAYIHGRVCSGGAPAAAAAVHVGQAITMTSSEGAYSAMVPSGVAVKIKAPGGALSAGPLSPGADLAVADIGDCGASGGGAGGAGGAGAAGGAGGGGPGGCGVPAGGCSAGLEPSTLSAGCCTYSGDYGCGPLGVCLDSCFATWYEWDGNIYGPCQATDQDCISKAASDQAQASIDGCSSSP